MGVKKSINANIGEAEINADRKEIVDILNRLYPQHFNSIPAILQNLNYQKLPFYNKTALSKSKAIITKIRYCKEKNLLRDHIGDIMYSELLENLRERFKKYLADKIFDVSKINKKHSDYYTYYYESYSEENDDYIIKYGIFGFDKDSKKNEWKGGKIYYLNDNEDGIGKVFDLVRIEPPIINTNSLFFSASYEEQINFFTLLIKTKAINSRGIIPLTYSVLETQNRFPCAGTAILEKIENNGYINKIQDLRDEKKGISDIIINSLFHHKFVVKDIVYKTLDEFKGDHVKNLNKVKGIWSGVHLRTDFGDDDSDDKGGICKFILNIKGSGECDFIWDKSAEETHKKTGFVEFPFGDAGFMKIYLEFLKKEKTYKLMLFLSSSANVVSKPEFKGIISGWMRDERKIYSSAVYIKKIGKSDDINKILDQETPSRIPKQAVQEIRKIGEEYIRGLQKAETKHLAVFSNCMPTK